MSFENPIKIEPKHIYEYNTNIVNNNKIDYVKLTEYQVSMPQTQVVNEKFACRERNESYTQTLYTHNIDQYYHNLFNSEKNNYAPLYRMRKTWPDHLGTERGYSYFRYFKIPIKAISMGQNCKFTFNRDVRFRAYSGDDALRDKINDVLISDYIFTPIAQSIYCGGDIYGAYDEYVYFNTFANVAAFENTYRGNEISSNYYVINITKRHQFIAGFTFDNGIGTLMLIVHDFDGRRASGSNFRACTVLLNFTITLTMDVYKSEPKTFTFALDNGVLKNVDDIPNFNYQNKKGYTVPDNPLLTNLTVRTDFNPNRKVSEVNAEHILTKFKNGKQTASMTVNCTDYYDMLGSKIIGEGVSRKTLEAGDYVIPYIKADEPLAKKKDGTPKKFEITSAEFTYEGLAQKHLKMVEVLE